MRRNYTPRSQIKIDVPDDWTNNLNNGLCWCGKSKESFDKGQKIYCSILHREKFQTCFIHWSDLREEVLEEQGRLCNICTSTPESLNKLQDEENKEIGAEVAIKYCKFIAEARILLLNELEKDYQKILNDDTYVFTQIDYSVKAENNIPHTSDLFKHNSFQLEVDHIKAIELGGEQWDKKNLQVLCNVCHEKKTIKDMVKIRQRKKGKSRK